MIKQEGKIGDGTSTRAEREDTGFEKYDDMGWTCCIEDETVEFMRYIKNCIE